VTCQYQSYPIRRLRISSRPANSTVRTRDSCKILDIASRQYRNIRPFTANTRPWIQLSTDDLTQKWTRIEDCRQAGGALKVKIKGAIAYSYIQQFRRGLTISPSLGNTACKWRYYRVWSVRCQTHGYLPGRKKLSLPLDWYSLPTPAV